VARRFEVRGHVGGITSVDDYGHLPAEIAAVLRAARGDGETWERIVVVFQPNRYSRMSVLSPDYADVFVDADVVVVADVYGSGERPIPGVTGELVVHAVRSAHPDATVVYEADRQALAMRVAPLVRAGDLVLSMGCGDISEFPDELLAVLREREAQ
jgi:UDP-N-acetylmuramate--alanine ligase